MRPQRNKPMRAPAMERAKLEGEYMEHYAIKLPEATANTIQRLGGGDLSAGVLELFEKYKSVRDTK